MKDGGNDWLDLGDEPTAGSILCEAGAGEKTFQFRKMEKTGIPLSPAIPRRREMLVPKSEQVHTIESPT
jgi:hypothetical protein